LSERQKRQVSDYYSSFVILLCLIWESGVSLACVNKTVRGLLVYQLGSTRKTNSQETFEFWQDSWIDSIEVSDWTRQYTIERLWCNIQQKVWEKANLYIVE
jgi:hypothetical protein